jgi:hypothetical protein
MTGEFTSQIHFLIWQIVHKIFSAVYVRAIHVLLEKTH